MSNIRLSSPLQAQGPINNNDASSRSQPAVPKGSIGHSVRTHVLGRTHSRSFFLSMLPAPLSSCVVTPPVHAPSQIAG